jgi:hypothetical protein
MRELVMRHVEAELAGDLAAAVSVYTDDVEHDVVGSPVGPSYGPAAAREFYEQLTTDLEAESMTPRREYYGDDFCVIEHECTGVVAGEFMGMAGHGKRATFRMLHLFEFKDDGISRENIWLDGGSIAAQLMEPRS